MIIVIMGVSGAGKSLIGKMLADDLGWPFFDADDYHPQASIEQMSRGIPLSEYDRVPWLHRITRLVEDLDAGSRPAVIACSALRQSYREMVAGKTGSVHFVYLKGDYELIRQRIRARKGHFMHPDLLRSQFEILEEPKEAVIVDVKESPRRNVSRIRQMLGL